MHYLTWTHFILATSSLLSPFIKLSKSISPLLYLHNCLPVTFQLSPSAEIALDLAVTRYYLIVNPNSLFFILILPTLMDG